MNVIFQFATANLLRLIVFRGVWMTRLPFQPLNVCIQWLSLIALCMLAFLLFLIEKISTDHIDLVSKRKETACSRRRWSVLLILLLGGEGLIGVVRVGWLIELACVHWLIHLFLYFLSEGINHLLLHTWLNHSTFLFLWHYKIFLDVVWKLTSFFIVFSKLKLFNAIHRYPGSDCGMLASRLV